MIKVDEDRTLDLDCQLYSVPAADLWWTFNDRVLSKAVDKNSQYQFLENFSQDPYLSNKTSVLRIRNFNDDVSGNYSCSAWYLEKPNPREPKSIKEIRFSTQVVNKKGPNILTPGIIAAIVIGSLLGFCLLCLLCCLLAFCCCYKRNFCCCFKVGGGKSTSSQSTTHLYSSKAKMCTDFDENSSGFNELNKTKPNYVINTISKSCSYLNDNSC
jgi:hypothetical protein